MAEEGQGRARNCCGSAAPSGSRHEIGCGLSCIVVAMMESPLNPAERNPAGLPARGRAALMDDRSQAPAPAISLAQQDASSRRRSRSRMSMEPAKRFLYVARGAEPLDVDIQPRLCLVGKRLKLPM